MILSVEFKNFQSHKNTTLHFVPGLNIIVGLTDAGKSAILRGIRWCLKNQPNGEDFRSWWGGDTEVSIDFDNGQLARIRKKGFNGYVLGMHDEFVALKSDVPDKVQQFINMDDVNLQQQLDTSFLLSKTAGDVAKHFNKIANLDQIDIATSNINSWISKLTQDIRYKEESLKENTTRLEEFSFIEKLESEVEILENLEKTLSAKIRKKKELNNLLVRISSVNEEIETYSNLLSLEPFLDNLLSKISLKTKKEEEYSTFEKLIKTIKGNEEKIKDLNKILPAELLLNEIHTKLLALNEKEKEYKNLKNAIQSLNKIKDEIVEATTSYNALHEELEINMPSVCPFCNNKIKKGKL